MYTSSGVALLSYLTPSLWTPPEHVSNRNGRAQPPRRLLVSKMRGLPTIIDSKSVLGYYHGTNRAVMTRVVIIDEGIEASYG